MHDIVDTFDFKNLRGVLITIRAWIMLNSALDGTFSPTMASVSEDPESYLDTVFFDVGCEVIRVRIVPVDVLNELECEVVLFWSIHFLVLACWSI